MTLSRSIQQPYALFMLKDSRIAPAASRDVKETRLFNGLTKNWQNYPPNDLFTWYLLLTETSKTLLPSYCNASKRQALNEPVLYNISVIVYPCSFSVEFHLYPDASHVINIPDFRLQVTKSTWEW